ncbi:MAG: prealbumin-like fold domain-containing protein [Candidatus Omnitrophica bacterium]|nr:prealbumin-like fold domain-containing protein [Candidatus Omnitrophota bacterium]
MRKTWLPLFFMAFFILSQTSDLFAQGGDIKGTIGIIMGDGAIRYGARIKVSLVTKSFPIPRNPGWDAEGIYTREEAYAKSYFNFCEQTEQEKDTNPNYVVAEVTSNLNGQFEFKNIMAGKYFILVDFPSVIGRNRVVWQLPITVTAGRTAEIELSNDNLAMPAFYDRYTR